MKGTIVVNKREMLVGLAALAVTFLMPSFFNIQTFGVYSSLADGSPVRETDLLNAALRLVSLNALRALPHYVGTFFVSESVEFRVSGKLRGFLNAALALVILRIIYYAIEKIYGIRYDFGIPALLVSLFVILFSRLNFRYISRAKKAVLVALVLTAMQFMDIMPVMSQFPVGRGETSMLIKELAGILECEGLMNITGGAGMMLFLTFSVFVLLQLREENVLHQLADLKERNQEIQTRAQILEMQNRTNREIQYLVHDLKSPLTAVQTMVGLIKMEHGMEHREKDLDYLDHMEQAVENMSSMISEILYPDRRAALTTKAILDIVLAQVSVTEYVQFIDVDNTCPDAVISVNRIQFARALVNLLQNAAKAIPEGKEPRIRVRVTRERKGDDHSAQEQVVFRIADNGKGIPKAKRERIWERGASEWGSSGLGLAFVKKVVETSGGQILLDSCEGKGTTFTIFIPWDTAMPEGMVK
ncbi:MAG: HAMP domain-containing histidine kinase [Lachnospiraceae bacterium]|nr:HAMP domain-containing histidine kinase [Lachnospiraceae bacterium]